MKSIGGPLAFHCSVTEAIEVPSNGTRMFLNIRFGVVARMAVLFVAMATHATARKLTLQQGVELNFEHRQRECDLYVTLSVDSCENAMYRSHCGHR